MPVEILDVIDGMIQIWIKVPGESKVCYCAPASGARVLAQINEFWCRHIAE